MVTDSSPYVIAQLIGAAISAASALMAWRKRNTPGGLPLSLLFLAATEWGLADAMGLATQQIEYKVWWEKLAIIGASTVAVFFLIFVLEYIRRKKLLATRGVLYLWIVPFSLMALAVTNEWHGLFWDNKQILIDQYGGVILIKRIGYWIHVAYSYSLRAIGTIVIGWTIIRYPARYRSQGILMLAGALTPWISNVIYIFFPFSIMGIIVSRIELHPIFFSLSGMILGVGILRYRLLDEIPIARDSILETISDGLIVIGADNRVMDINPAAHKILHLETDPLGQPIEIALKNYPALIDQVAHEESGGEIDIEQYHQQIEAGISIVKGAGNQISGKVIALRDITERRNVEKELRRSRAELKAIFDNARAGIYMTDAQGKFTFVNSHWMQMLDLPAEQIIGTSLFSYIHLYDIPHNRDLLDELRDHASDHYNVENRFVQSNKNLFWGELSAAAIYDQEDQLESVIGFVVDITERKRAEQEIRESERRFREILQNVQLFAVMLDAQGNITFVNDHLLRGTEWTKEEVIGKNWFDHFLSKEAASRHDYARSLKIGTIAPQHENMIRTRAGDTRTVRWSNILLRDIHNHIIGTASIGEDVTELILAEKENARLYAQSLIEIEERTRAQEKLAQANQNLAIQLEEIQSLQALLKEQAIRDPITGLFNRRYLEETLERETARAARDSHPLSIVMLDIDHFKLINDSYTHAAGDEMLKKLGELLMHETRKDDIACRYGGEEFAVIMPGAAANIAQQRAEGWRKTIEKLEVTYKEHTFKGTISLGVANFPTDGSLGKEVLACADKALYTAKNSGRNRVVVYKKDS